MLSIAVVDDEKKAVDDFTRHVERYEREENENVKISVFESAEKFLYDYKPLYDVVFMDIEMTGMNGMDAAKRLRKCDEKVFLIFVTNMTQYALGGYRVDALDYFVKPVNYYDLKMRLDRVRRLMKGRAKVYVPVPIAGGVKSVSSDDIYYVEVNNHTIVYHTAEGNFGCRGKSLNEIEKELAGADFARCNVCYLVNLKHCEELTSVSVRVGGDLLRVSRPKRRCFAEKFTEFFGGGKK